MTVQAPPSKKVPILIGVFALLILAFGGGSKGLPFNSSDGWTKKEHPKAPIPTERFEERFVRVIVELDRRRMDEVAVRVSGVIGYEGGVHDFQAKNNYIHDYPARTGSQVSVLVARSPVDDGGRIFCAAYQVGIPGQPDEHATSKKFEQAFCQVVVI